MNVFFVTRQERDVIKKLLESDVIFMAMRTVAGVILSKGADNFFGEDSASRPFFRMVQEFVSIRR